MKIPQWMTKTPTHVQHPYSTLKDAARVLRIDAKLLRKQGQSEDALCIQHVATRLDCVASGETWAYAFDLPEQTSQEKKS